MVATFSSTESYWRVLEFCSSFKSHELLHYDLLDLVTTGVVYHGNHTSNITVIFVHWAYCYAAGLVSALVPAPNSRMNKVLFLYSSSMQIYCDGIIDLLCRLVVLQLIVFRLLKTFQCITGYTLRKNINDFWQFFCHKPAHLSKTLKIGIFCVLHETKMGTFVR